MSHFSKKKLLEIKGTQCHSWLHPAYLYPRDVQCWKPTFIGKQVDAVWSAEQEEIRKYAALDLWTLHGQMKDLAVLAALAGAEVLTDWRHFLKDLDTGWERIVQSENFWIYLEKGF